MGKEARVWKIFLAFVFIIAIAHTSLYFASLKGGISGLSVEDKSLESIFLSPQRSQTSLVFLAVEWCIVVLGFLVVYSLYRSELRKEYLELRGLNEKKQSKENKTEIDDLYDFLKQKKHFRISTIAKVFKVDKDVVEDWAKTLEHANLVTINYPRIGGPMLTLNEEKKVKEK